MKQYVTEAGAVNISWMGALQHRNWNNMVEGGDRRRSITEGEPFGRTY